MAVTSVVLLSRVIKEIIFSTGLGYILITSHG